MKVRFFGCLRDAIGDEVEVDVPAGVGDSEALRGWLGRERPELLDARVKMALDDAIAVAPCSLHGVSEVAFLPPLSGG